MGRRTILLIGLGLTTGLIILSQVQWSSQYNQNIELPPNLLVFIGFTLLNILVWEISADIHRSTRTGSVVLGCLCIGSICLAILLFLSPPTQPTDYWNNHYLLVIGGIDILLSAAWSLVVGSAYQGRAPPKVMVQVAVAMTIVLIFIGLFYDYRTKAVTFFIMMIPIVLAFEALVSAMTEYKWKQKEGSNESLDYAGMLIVISLVCAGYAILISSTFANS